MTGARSLSPHRKDRPSPPAVARTLEYLVGVPSKTAFGSTSKRPASSRNEDPDASVLRKITSNGTVLFNQHVKPRIERLYKFCEILSMRFFARSSSKSKKKVKHHRWSHALHAKRRTKNVMFEHQMFDHREGHYLHLFLLKLAKFAIWLFWRTNNSRSNWKILI